MKGTELSARLDAPIFDLYWPSIHVAHSQNSSMPSLESFVVTAKDSIVTEAVSVSAADWSRSKHSHWILQRISQSNGSPRINSHALGSITCQL